MANLEIEIDFEPDTDASATFNRVNNTQIETEF